jgi:hypothetical protein
VQEHGAHGDTGLRLDSKDTQGGLKLLGTDVIDDRHSQALSGEFEGDVVRLYNQWRGEWPFIPLRPAGYQTSYWIGPQKLNNWHARQR